MSQLLDTVPALLEGMLPLLTTPAEAAPLRACGAVLYGGAPLGAAALMRRRRGGGGPSGAGGSSGPSDAGLFLLLLGGATYFFSAKMARCDLRATSSTPTRSRRSLRSDRSPSTSPG